MRKGAMKTTWKIFALENELTITRYYLYMTNKQETGRTRILMRS